MNYGKAVRAAREAKGWTVRQLAEKLQSPELAYWIDLVEGDELNGFGEEGLQDFAIALDMPMATLLLLGAEEE